MPRIPRYEGGVQQQALQVPSLSGNAPRDAFAPDLSQASSAVAKIALAAQERADLAAVEEFKAGLLQFDSSLEFGSQDQRGWLNVEGKASNALPDEVPGKLKSWADERLNTMSPSQQRAAKSILRQQETSLSGRLNRHVYQQNKLWEENAKNAAVKASIEFGAMHYDSPDDYAASLENIRNTLRANAVADANERGDEVDPQTLSNEIRAAQSEVHRKAIADMLQTQQYDKAEQWLNQWGDAMLVSDKQTVQEAVLKGGVIAKEQRTTADILTRFDNEKEALAYARDNVDARMQDGVYSRIKLHYADQRRLKQESLEERAVQAEQMVMSGTPVADLPPTVTEGLSQRTLDALRGVQEAKANGHAIETNTQEWYNLVGKAIDSPNEFASMNLMEYSDKLSQPHFMQLRSAQQSIRNGKSADDKLKWIRNENQVVDDTMRSIGINPNKDGEAAAAFRRRMQDMMTQYQQDNGGKRPNPTEWERMVKLEAVRGARPGTGWFGTNFRADEAHAFQLPTGTVLDVDIADVPKQDRLMIEDTLRRNNKPITDDAILDLYLMKSRVRRP
jgi:hypothetical protein